MESKYKLTARQKIRLRSWFHLAVLVVLLICVIVFIVLLTGRLRLSRDIERAELQAQEATLHGEEEEAAAEQAAGAEERLPEVDPDEWYLRLVRSDMPLEADYAPEVGEIERGEMFDVRALAPLQALIQAAREAGYSVYVCSGYRSYDTQYVIYWNHVYDYKESGMTQEEAEAATRLAVNYPGGSEHQLGLAADILEYEDQDMEPWIGGSGLMLWLEENCADYGFVVRYPDGKTDITGVEYEPWHLRYVGPAASYIMDNGLCLEEFLALYE